MGCLLSVRGSLDAGGDINADFNLERGYDDGLVHELTRDIKVPAHDTFPNGDVLCEGRDMEMVRQLCPGCGKCWPIVHYSSLQVNCVEMGSLTTMRLGIQYLDLFQYAQSRIGQGAVQ